jgi:hypothetical protein
MHFIRPTVELRCTRSRCSVAWLRAHQMYTVGIDTGQHWPTYYIRGGQPVVRQCQQACMQWSADDIS